MKFTGKQNISQMLLTITDQFKHVDELKQNIPDSIKLPLILKKTFVSGFLLHLRIKTILKICSMLSWDDYFILK